MTKEIAARRNADHTCRKSSNSCLGLSGSFCQAKALAVPSDFVFPVPAFGQHRYAGGEHGFDQGGFIGHAKLGETTEAPGVIGDSKCPYTNLPTGKAGRWGEGVTAEDMANYIWVKPQHDAEINFTEWTSGSVLRHAENVGLRDDKEPTEIAKESAFLLGKDFLNDNASARHCTQCRTPL